MDHVVACPLQGLTQAERALVDEKAQTLRICGHSQAASSSPACMRTSSPERGVDLVDAQLIGVADAPYRLPRPTELSDHLRPHIAHHRLPEAP